MILSLDNCDKCDSYKILLNNNVISYDNISCSQFNNCSQCDRIEKIASTNLYPITIINDKYIVSLTTDYSKLGTINNNDRYTVIYSHSTNNMLDIVKKFLNL